MTDPISGLAAKPQWAGQHVPALLAVLTCLAGIAWAGQQVVAEPQAAAEPLTNRLPAHATPRSYGDGWDCVRGYRRQAGLCQKIAVPDHA